MHDWKLIYFDYVKLLRSLSLDSNKRFSGKTNYSLSITLKLHILLFHIFWTVYCNSNNHSMATSLTNRSNTFFVEFICISHDERPIDEDFEGTVSNGFQFAIKNTIGEFKCSSKTKRSSFNLIYNSNSIITKIMYIANENQIDIDEDLLLIIAENTFVKKNIQGSLAQFQKTIIKGTKDKRIVLLLIVVYSFIVAADKTDSINTLDVFTNLSTIEKIPKSNDDLINFAESFAKGC